MKRAAAKSKIVSEKEDTCSDICFQIWYTTVMTPHTMRHTFCTRMANTGMNPKALQYIMGHANIVMTLNYYAHATFQSAQAEMARLEAAKVETTVVVAETTVENTEETKAAA